MFLEQDVGRSCGECTACCKPYVVPEVDKHDSNWCKFCAIGKGCTIYAERPHACRIYACLWLNGKGDDSWRPDRLGVLMDWEEITINEELICILHLFEMEKGALDQPVIQRVVESNLDNGTVIVLHYQHSDTDYSGTIRMRSSFFTEIDAQAISDALKRQAAPAR